MSTAIKPFSQMERMIEMMNRQAAEAHARMDVMVLASLLANDGHHQLLRFLQRKPALVLKRDAAIIQKHVQGKAGRRAAMKLRAEAAVIRIQKAARDRQAFAMAAMLRIDRYIARARLNRRITVGVKRPREDTCLVKLQ